MSDFNTNLPLADGINNLFSGIANRQIVKKQRQWADEDFKKRVDILGIEGAQKEQLAQNNFENKKELDRRNNASKPQKNPFQDSIASVYNYALKDQKAGNSNNLFSALVDYGKGAEDPQARKEFMKLGESDLNAFYNGNWQGLSLEEINKLEKEAQGYINMGIGLSTNEFEWARSEIQTKENLRKKEEKELIDKKENFQDNLINAMNPGGYNIL